MADFITAKVKLATGGITLEYEGNESFLLADLPKFIEAVTALRNPDLAGSASPLRGTVRDFYVTMEAMSDALTALRTELDSLGEISEMESLRLQMAMDRLSKLMSTLSNLLKKMPDTSQAIVSNLK
jgi:hypothetical protein